ncbi:MAG: carbohydrate ABC transporter permease [Candidatus Hydrogenedentes bacterium]|nr:carbohydrate ABC transporter permease [Candidatus Hydrogenedentota bacterium]
MRTALTYAALILVTGLLVFPFAWMALTSLKPLAEVTAYPPAWIPSELRWENYREAWNAAPFGRFYMNSAITGIAATSLQVAIALLMAYAFAWIRFPGKSALLILVIATMMVPDEVKLVPNFLVLRRLDWIDTYWALIIPPAAHAFPVFVLYQQFRVLPAALIDAARIDGAGHLRISLGIVTPLSKPALAAITVVALLGRWNDYLWPLVVTNRTIMRTLPIGLAYLKEAEAGRGIRWNLLMAGSIFVVIPIVILYIILQRQFVEGVTRGAVKT